MDPKVIRNLLDQIQDAGAGVYEIASAFDPESGFDAQAVFHGSTEDELTSILEALHTAFNALTDAGL